MERDAASEMPQEARDLAGLLVELTKTQKTLRLYEGTHTAWQKVEADLHARWSAFLEDLEGVDLAISEFRISYRGHPVYENHDRNDSLAFLLFRDGIRRLSFLPELPAEELHGFLTALNKVRVVSNEEADLVTLLWEQDLQSIRYFAVDELRTGTEGPRIEEKLAKGIVDADEPGGAAETAKISFKDLEQPVSQLPMQSSQLSEAEAESLHAELAAEEQADFSRVAVELALELTHLAPDDEARSETAQGLREVLLRLLEEDVASLARAVEHLSQLAMSQFSDSAPVSRMLAECLDALSQPDSVTRFLRRLDEDRCLEPAALTSYLERLGTAAVPAIVPWMGQLDRPELRRAVSEALVEAGGGALKELEQRLPVPGKSTDLKLVREILYVLGHHSEQSALPLLRTLLGSDDPRIRRETALTLGRYRGRPAFELWLDLLEDHDADIRGLAIAALARGQGRGLARLMLDRLQSSEAFVDWGLDDKRRAFRAVARLAGEAALPWFAETLRPGRWRWIVGRARRELESAAAHGIRSVGTDSARSLLRDLASSRDRFIRAACLRELESVEK